MQYWIYGKMTKTRNQLVLCLLFVLVLMLWRRIIIMYIYECGECVHLKKGGCYNNTYLNNNGFWGTSSRDEENHIILLFTRKRDGCAAWCASRVHVQTTVHYSFLLGKGTLKCTFSKKNRVSLTSLSSATLFSKRFPFILHKFRESILVAIKKSGMNWITPCLSCVREPLIF